MFQRAVLDLIIEAAANGATVVNDALDPHEQLECLVVVAEPWSIENGFITPTFEVKRNRVEEAYGPLFERWTAAGRAVVWHAA